MILSFLNEKEADNMKKTNYFLKLFGLAVLFLLLGPLSRTEAAAYKPVDTSKLSKEHAFYTIQNGVQYKNTLYYQAGNKIYAYTNARAAAGKKPKRIIDKVWKSYHEKNLLIYITENEELHYYSLASKTDKLILKGCHYISELSSKYLTCTAGDDWKKEYYTYKGRRIKKPDSGFPAFDTSGFKYYTKSEMVINGDYYVGLILEDATSSLYKYKNGKYVPVITGSKILTTEYYMMDGTPYFIDVNLYDPENADCGNYIGYSKQTTLYRFENDKFTPVGKNDMSFMNTQELSVKTYDNFMVIESAWDIWQEFYIIDSNFRFLYHGEFNEAEYNAEYAVKDGIFYTYYRSHSGKKQAKQFTRVNLKDISQGKKKMVSYTTDGRFTP